MDDTYHPDFIERNGAWLLSVVGILGSCTTAVLVYFLRSRCRRIRCCGCECERDVLDLETTQNGGLALRSRPRPPFRRTSDANSEAQ